MVRSGVALCVGKVGSTRGKKVGEQQVMLVDEETCC